MCSTDNEKWEKRNNGRNKMKKSGKYQNIWREEELGVLEGETIEQS